MVELSRAVAPARHLQWLSRQPPKGSRSHRADSHTGPSDWPGSTCLTVTPFSLQRPPLSKLREPDKALACFGAVRQDTGERFLYFSDGQPDAERTILMLERLLEVARREKKRVLVIIWDRASWHKSQKLKE